MSTGFPNHVGGALVRPAVTNMWYVTNSRGNTFAVCAAHSLITAKVGQAHVSMRFRGITDMVAAQDLRFYIPSDHLLSPSLQTDFAIAPVATLPANAAALPLYKHPIEAPTHLTFVYSHRFDVTGERIPTANVSLGVHPAVAIADDGGALYRCLDTGFPGFSGAAGLMMPSCEPFATPSLAALFVGIADPALPRHLRGRRAAPARPVPVPVPVPVAVSLPVPVGSGDPHPPPTSGASDPSASALPTRGAPRGWLMQHMWAVFGLDLLESRFAVMEARLDSFDARFASWCDRVEAHLRSELDSRDGRHDSRFDSLESRVLTRDDTKAVIRATQRRWGVAVAAHRIEEATFGEMPMTPLDEALRTPATPAWLTFEQRLAESKHEWQGDGEAAGGEATS